MDRAALLEQAADTTTYWDFIIIGGGATGLGAAVDAAARGYKTLLLEQADFGKGTSSRSTKLVHGGVRYLQQGNVSLVLEALRERGRLLKNAPHLVKPLAFVLPCYRWWERAYYGVGLKLYDKLAGKLGFGASRLLDRRDVLAHLPTATPEGLRGGVCYYDGQFDDTRLALSLAQTCAGLGGVPLNYMQVTGLRKHEGRVCGVTARDLEGGAELALHARAVINATGVFADAVRQMDQAEARPIIRPSQGVHIVLDRRFLPGDSALMLPRTDDGRVLFGIPWHGRLLLGTTDTDVDTIDLEPRPLEQEVDFLLAHAGRYLTRQPTRADVLSTFAGLRPLVSAGKDGDTKSISRDHVLRISPSGLVTITGGKWTTYRKMGEDTIDKATRVAGLDARPCRTYDLRLHGWLKHDEAEDALAGYGSEAPAVRRLAGLMEGGAEPLHPRLPYLRAEVVWAARHEMARTVEDVLARRTRALLLDARASLEAAPGVARLLAETLGRDAAWQRKQLSEYRELAAGYLLPGTELPVTPVPARKAAEAG